MMHDWRPRTAPDMLARRARLLRDIRTFMQDREVLEVETPVLGRRGNPDPNIQALITHLCRPGRREEQAVYLQTSPEFPMKRLLAAGSGSIYQICKVFRDGEHGRHHQPEFTMLEWYRVGFDHHDLMDEIAELLAALQLDEPERLDYGRVFADCTGLDPHRDSDERLRQRALATGLAATDADRDLLLDYLFSHEVAPRLGVHRPCFVYDYPACQAALARLRRDPDGDRAERFELFINSMEIANGYNELTDYYEQDSRFGQDNKRRSARGLPVIPADADVIAALKAGLPACAGVALGLDRLLMVLTGAESLDEVLAFPLH